MPKKTVLEKLLDEIDSEIAETDRKHASTLEVLRHSRARIVAQQADAAAKKAAKATAAAGEPCDDRR